MWNFQTLDNTNNFQAFDSVEALQNANPIEADYILGLGNKKKKAEKKLVKAEKAIQQGNTKKAEKKLNKAIKKGVQVADDKRGDLSSKINVTRDKIGSENEKKGAFLDSVSPPKKVEDIKTIDPVTLPDAPNVNGSGLVTPVSGGGGGEMGGGMEQQTEQANTPEEIKDGGVMPPVTITNKKTNYLMLAVIVFVLVGVFLYLKRKK